MPEGPEVRIVIDKIRYHALGHNLKEIIIDDSYSEKESLKQNISNIANFLPSKLIDVCSVGKQIFMFLENGFILNSFLSMTGHWLYNKELKHTRLIFDFEYFKFYYDDVRKWGRLKIITFEQMNEKILDFRYDFMNIVSPQLHIKNEILSKLSSTFFDRITPEKFYDIINKTGKRSPNKEICLFLLDQKKISGVGNYIKSESLYLSKIHPHKTCINITKEEAINLYNAIIDVMRNSYIKNGLTLGDFITPDFECGYYDVIIYGKENKLDQNGYKIKCCKDKDRKTFYVEEIQKL